MRIHRYRMRVPFGDVDHAGLVYYPQVFHYFHLAYEDFLAGGLGRALPDLLAAGHLAPIVRSEADFRAPLRHGMEVEVSCWIRSRGRSAWHWAFEIREVSEPADDPPRVRGEVTKVFVDPATMRSQAPPSELVDLVQPYVQTP